MIDILSNISNLLLINFLIIIAIQLNYLPTMAGILLMIMNLGPFIINGPIIDVSYMPDQSEYYNSISYIRSLQLDFLDGIPKKIVYSSFIYSAIPLPFVTNLVSVAIFNRFLVSILLIWGYRNKVIDKSMLYLLIFFPSLLLYSSLALREILILSFMLISGVFLIQRKIFYCVLFLMPLYLIKPHFFLVLSLIFVSHLVLFNKLNLYRKNSIALFIFISVILVMLFAQDIINGINHYGYSFGLESNITFEEISSLSVLIPKLLENSILFVVRPYLNVTASSFTIFSFIENIILMLFIVYLIIKFYSTEIVKLCFWLIALLVTGSIHSLLAVNDGTLSRYKFLLVSFVIIMILYDIKISKVTGNSKPVHNILSRQNL